MKEGPEGNHIPSGPSFRKSVLLKHFDNLHGTGLDADAACDAFRRFVLRENDYFHRTYFRTFSAADAQFLIDHVDSLRILLDRTLLTGSGTFSALKTGAHLHGSVFFLADLYAGISRIVRFSFVKRFAARYHTGLARIAIARIGNL